MLVGHYPAPSQNVQDKSNSQQEKGNYNVSITEPVKVSLGPDEEQIKREIGRQESEDKREESNASWTKANVILNIILFGVVAFQGFMAWRQWKSMHRQSDLVENMFYIGERAYLALAGMTVDAEALERSEAPGVQLKVKNGGKTPAFNVRIAIKAVMVGGIDNFEKLVTDENLKADIQQSLSKKKWLSTEIGHIVLPGDFAQGKIGSGKVAGKDAIAWWEQRSCFYTLVRISFFDIRGTDERCIIYHTQFIKDRGLSMTDCQVFDPVKTRPI